MVASMSGSQTARTVLFRVTRTTTTFTAIGWSSDEWLPGIQGDDVSRLLSLKNREVDALKELESSNPDLIAIKKKLETNKPIRVLPGQFSLEDYPEVFDDAA